MSVQKVMDYLSQCRIAVTKRSIVENSVIIEELKEKLAEQQLILKRNGAILDLKRQKIAQLNRETRRIKRKRQKLILD